MDSICQRHGHSQHHGPDSQARRQQLQAGLCRWLLHRPGRLLAHRCPQLERLPAAHLLCAVERRSGLWCAQSQPLQRRGWRSCSQHADAEQGPERRSVDGSDNRQWCGSWRLHQ
ncbi:hypothetical protein KBI23_10895 [bacterium]|nr:hypothetical protein [bacterium]MBP9810266.1 hypothetical protein [bacterium]